jgi:hypothetical protein
MAEEQFQPRQVAYKIRIGDLSRGEYVEQEGWQPNFIKIGERQVSRVNIIASVIDKEIGDSLGTLTIDDGSGDIQVRAFKEESVKLNDIEIGEIILVIGRPRKYGNRFFISYEIVKKVDALWAKVRQKELGEAFGLKPSPKEENNVHEEKVSSPPPLQENVEVKEETVKVENVEGEKSEFLENKKTILDLIRGVDNGDGASIEDVKVNSKLDSEKAENMIQDLIKAGEIYENIAGRVKLL